MVVMEDIAHQLGAHPKSPSEWSGSTIPQGRAPAPLNGKRHQENLWEKSKFVCQAIEVPNPQQPTGEGTLAAGVPIVQDADSEEDDPM
ncbi:hypothetical protein E2320_002344, partial [Naja naja]